MIVIDGYAIGFDLPLLKIDSFDLTKDNLNVSMVRKDVTDGPSNISRRESSSRDLIKQRLKKVVVALIDNRYIDRLAGETPGRGKSAKTGTNDDHVCTAG
jgi:hypothetical protein